MVLDIDKLEKQRLILQSELDARKTQIERNRLGQFATPTALSVDILKYAATLLPQNEPVRFLDPAIGTGAFYSALQRVIPNHLIVEARGFEIDPHYAVPASRLWTNSGLVIDISDFTKAEPSSRFNLVICNPPYVRHHHLNNGEKARLKLRTYDASGMQLSGLAGLYCHFLGLSQSWMADGGIAGWLIPSEFMDVNYGHQVKHYLLNRVTLLNIHRFDPNDVQFADALVSSSVIWFRNATPPKDHKIKFSFGGTLLEPKLSREVNASILVHEPKWTRFPASDIRTRENVATLSDFFQIKRGLATGDNDYFILDAKAIEARGLPMEVFRPILPSPRYLPEDEIHADNNGYPLSERRLFLLDTKLDEAEIRERYPSLYGYIEEGKARRVPERYLCRHREPWYSQETRLPAPIVCTYLGRGDTKTKRPFRFILNHSRATVANVYLAMYPTPLLTRALYSDPSLLNRIWQALNAMTPDQLLGEGRVYGGGLHKLEPKELARVEATTINLLIPDMKAQGPIRQMEIFETAEKRLGYNPL